MEVKFEKSTSLNIELKKLNSTILSGKITFVISEWIIAPSFISIFDKSINLKFDSKNLVFIMLELFKIEFSKSALRNVEFDKFLLVKFT